jgi:hypothetical protein
MPNDNSCLTLLTADLLVDCANRDIGFLQERAVLINYSHIDRALTTLDVTNPKIITDLILTGVNTGFLLEGIKTSNAALAEIVYSNESYSKWRHSYSGRIYNLTAAQRRQIDLMVGGRFVAVLDKKWTGEDGEDGFIVLGFNRGLELIEGSEATNENDGSFVFKLATTDEALESEGFKIFLDTDRATSQTAFENLFG